MATHSSAHGLFDLKVKGQVLTLVAKGQWNFEAALEFEQEWIKLATPISQAPWAHVVYLDEWDLNTPDVEPVITRVVGWSVTHKMTHVAQIYSPSLLKKYELDKMVGDKDLPFKKQVFWKEDEALEWLASCGFEVTDEH